MIEFYGWIFDFENMRAVDSMHRQYRLMKLNNEFYVQLESDVVNNTMMIRAISYWHWPKFQFAMEDFPNAVGEAFDSRKNKKLTETYLTWCIESTVFGST